MSEPRRVRKDPSQARWIDWFGAWFGHEKAAEIRFKLSNQIAFEQGCRCGKPSEVVQEFGDVVGNVPHQVWTCKEHYGVSGWQTIGGVTTPAWDRPEMCSNCWHRTDLPDDAERTECQGWGGPIGGPTTYWVCPKRPEVP